MSPFPHWLGVRIMWITLKFENPHDIMCNQNYRNKDTFRYLNVFPKMELIHIFRLLQILMKFNADELQIWTFCPDLFWLTVLAWCHDLSSQLMYITTLLNINYKNDFMVVIFLLVPIIDKRISLWNVQSFYVNWKGIFFFSIDI